MDAVLHGSTQRLQRWLPARDLRAAAGARNLSALDRPAPPAVDPTPIPSTYHFAGYEVLLQAIAAKDPAAFEAQRARLEAAYPARRKERESALNWSGGGKLSRAATFDALGTALCHLAVRRGLAVDVDTRLYPRAFMHAPIK